jgi:hypothetical protein
MISLKKEGIPTEGLTLIEVEADSEVREVVAISSEGETIEIDLTDLEIEGLEWIEIIIVAQEEALTGEGHLKEIAVMVLDF